MLEHMNFRICIESSKSRSKKSGGIWVGFYGDVPPFPGYRESDWMEETIMLIKGFEKV